MRRTLRFVIPKNEQKAFTHTGTLVKVPSQDLFTKYWHVQSRLKAGLSSFLLLRRSKAL